MPPPFLFNEQKLFLQPQLAAQAHTSEKPNLDLMTDRQMQSSGQFAGREPAPLHPARVPIRRAMGVEIEFTLGSLA